MNRLSGAMGHGASGNGQRATGIGVIAATLKIKAQSVEWENFVLKFWAAICWRDPGEELKPSGKSYGWSGLLLAANATSIACVISLTDLDANQIKSEPRKNAWKIG